MFCATPGDMQTQPFPTLDAHYALVLGLTPPWVITNVNLDIAGAKLEINVVYDNAKGTCPECNAVCCVLDLREERSWRHLDMMQFATTISARVPRVTCEKHKTKTLSTPWAGPRSHFTLLFERFAIEVLQATSSVTHATKLLGISWHQAQLLKERAVSRGMARRNEDNAVVHVGLDEKSFLKGHHYATLATDLDRGCVLDVEEGRTKEAAEILLKRALTKQQRRQIQAGAMDMWAPFLLAWRAVIGEETPIVHDKFHVSGYLGKAVDLVRRKEHRTLRADGKETLTKTKYLWLKNPDNWKDEERARFEALKTDELKVGRAWAIKESFRQFWEYVHEWSAKQFFARWYFWATHSHLQPVIDAAKTLKRHLPGLLAYCTHKITNAVTEGLNSKIQTIKANARGFRNFEHYRIAILFQCGKLDMLP